MLNILITGASSGIGLALAEAYLQQGHRVFALARNAQALAALTASFGPQCVPVVADVTHSSAMAQALQQLQEHTTGLDIAVINAGTCEYVEAHHFNTQPFTTVTAVNWLGAVASIALCLPLLRNAYGGPRRPQLVVVSSLVTGLPLPRSQAYGGTKAALDYCVNSLRVDCAHEPLDITLVRPGFVKTPLTDRNDFAMPWAVSAASAAHSIVKGVAARRWQVAFPWPLVAVMTLVGCLPLRWQVRLLQRMVPKQARG